MAIYIYQLFEKGHITANVNVMLGHNSMVRGQSDACRFLRIFH